MNKEMDSVTKNAILSRLSGMRYRISQLDNEFKSEKSIDEKGYKEGLADIIAEIDQIEKYLETFEQGEEQGDE